MLKRFVATVVMGGVWMLSGEFLSFAQPVTVDQPSRPGRPSCLLWVSLVPITAYPAVLQPYAIGLGLTPRLAASQPRDDITTLSARAQQGDADDT